MVWPLTTSGLLYVAVFGQGDVTVLGLNGEVVERISTEGLLPTNVAFALPGEHRIHVTEFQHGQVEVFPGKPRRPSACGTGQSKSMRGWLSERAGTTTARFPGCAGF